MDDWISCCHIASVFGTTATLTARAAFGILLIGIVTALAIIDLRKTILPDHLNLALAWAGACQSFALGAPKLPDAALGAVLAGASLWLLNGLYRRLRGVDGLGLGDVKFAAAAGLWTGWQGLPFMLCVASTSALAFVILRALRDRQLDRTTRLPFGPFLGLGMLVAWTAMVTS